MFPDLECFRDDWDNEFQPTIWNAKGFSTVIPLNVRPIPIENVIISGAKVPMNNGDFYYVSNYGRKLGDKYSGYLEPSTNYWDLPCYLWKGTLRPEFANVAPAKTAVYISKEKFLRNFDRQRETVFSRKFLLVRSFKL